MAIQAYETISPWTMTQMGKANQLNNEDGHLFGAVRYTQGRPYLAAMKKHHDAHSPTWSPLTSRGSSLNGSPQRASAPRSPIFLSSSAYRRPVCDDPTRDPISRLNPENTIMSPSSPLPGTARGSSIVLYGTLRSDVYQRPATNPKPYKLSTPLRSRRPKSVEGFYPSGKGLDTSQSLQERLAVRELRVNPPREIRNISIGSVRIMVRDMQPPGQSPKEGEFSRMSDAVSRGNIFARSLAGAKPCLI